MVRKTNRNTSQDNRKYLQIGNKENFSSKMEDNRKMQDQHCEKQNSLYFKRQLTKVITTNSKPDSHRIQFKQQELLDFNKSIKVEDFETKLQPERMQVVAIDKVQHMKFADNLSFDQFMTPAIFDTIQSALDEFKSSFASAERVASNSNVMRILDENIPGGFHITEEFCDFNELQHYQMQQEQYQLTKKTKCRVQKHNILHKVKIERKQRQVIPAETKILVFSLYLQNIQMKRISELTKVPFNNIKSVIYRMRKGTLTNTWDPNRIERKNLSPDQLNSLFKQLDEQKGDDTSFKVVKNQLRSKFQFQAKKSMVYSLLAQGNFVKKTAVKCSKGEEEDQFKQRKQLYNIQFQAVISRNGQPWVFQDEFGVMLSSNNHMVFCRRGEQKYKNQSKQDTKLNVAFAICGDSVLNYQISKEGQTSIASMQQLQETVKQIVRKYPRAPVVQLSCDGASMHTFNPALNWLERFNQRNTVKVVNIINSANNSKVNVIERTINVLKLAIKQHQVKNVSEMKDLLDLEFRQLSKEKVCSTWRRTISDWKEYSIYLHDKLQG